MPRKPRKVSTHDVRNYGTIELRLDAAAGEWSAEIRGNTLTSDTRAGLVKLIEAEAAKTLNIVWHGIIEVRGLGKNKVEADDEPAVDLMLHLTRFWVAKKTVGGWIKSEWENAAWRGVWKRDQPTDERTKRAHDARRDYTMAIIRPVARKTERYGRQHDDHLVHMPYTDETWAALLDIQRRMIELDRALAKLISSKAGYALLTAGGGVPMLTAPAVEADPEEAADA